MRKVSAATRDENDKSCLDVGIQLMAPSGRSEKTFLVEAKQVELNAAYVTYHKAFSLVSLSFTRVSAAEVVTLKGPPL